MKGKVIIASIIGLSISNITWANYKAPKRYPIVETSDPHITTDYMQAGDITLGVSDLGGGYVNYFSIPGTGNIVSANYGRGWQGSIRDRLHGGRYNPTQAGFRDNAGAPVAVNSTSSRISIPPFQMALYGDPVYDFTQHEDLVPDASSYSDRGVSDKDGVNESNKNQDDEIRSEFDYQGSYEDVSYLTSRYGVSAIRHVYRNTYVREPNAIKQFGENAIREDGRNVYDPSKIIMDISPKLEGKQTPKSTDLSDVVFTAYGIRIKTSSGFTTGMWHDGKSWHTLKAGALSSKNDKIFQINEGGLEERNHFYEKLSNNLLIWSKGGNPSTSDAIGIYSPNSDRNRYQTIGRRVTDGEISYSEDRRYLSTMRFTRAIPEQLAIRTRYFITGIMAPNQAKEGYIEGLRHESYILHGTPSAILASLRALD